MISFPKNYPVTSHTDHVGPGSTFVVIKGMKEDGIDYIKQALEKGATRIVLEIGTRLSPDVEKEIRDKGCDIVFVKSPRLALAELSAQAYGYPAQGLKIIAITGTKGKTTTSYLIEHVLRESGLKTALLSTVKNKIGDVVFDASLTTAQPDYLHTFFSLCRQQGVEYVVMEVAAQALSLHRTATLLFDAIVFTNFSLEHSEFYATQDDYFKAKCAIFDQLKPFGKIILNADDKKVSSLHLSYPRRVTYGLSPQATYSAHAIENSLSGLSFKAFVRGSDKVFESKTLLGEFSVANILASFAVAEECGIAPEVVAQAVATFEGVPGRLQRMVLPNGSVAFIDTAHSPSSFEALLSTLRPLSTDIIVVFGAGGDRDASKRPIMGALAAHYADKVIVTTDNPRSEDPEIISESIIEGIPLESCAEIHRELDREKAIRLAYTLSKEGSIIALLGKGPVEYQHIKNKKIPFSETAILRSL